MSKTLMMAAVAFAAASQLYGIPPAANTDAGEVIGIGQGTNTLTQRQAPQTYSNSGEIAIGQQAISIGQGGTFTLTQRRQELDRTRRKIETIRQDIQNIGVEVDRLLHQIQAKRAYVEDRQQEMAGCINMREQYQRSGIIDNPVFAGEVNDCFGSLQRDSGTYRWILAQARRHLETMQRLKAEAQAWHQRIPSLEARIRRLTSEIRFLEGENSGGGS